MSVDWNKGGQGGQGGYGGYGEQPSYPQPGYGQPSQGGGYGQPPIPPTNAGWAAAATLFFWPLAFAAWNASSDVVRLWAMGDLAGSQAASDRAKRMGKISLWLLVGLFVLYVVFVVVIFGFALSSASSY